MNKFIIILIVGFGNLFAQQGRDSTKLVIIGQSAVFFGPSQQEYDSLAKDENSGIDEILSDFYYYQAPIAKFLKEHKIGVELTSAPLIVAQLSDGKTQTYHRRDFGQVVGVLLIDGTQEPKVMLGVETDVDLIPELEKFFKLK